MRYKREFLFFAVLLGGGLCALCFLFTFFLTTFFPYTGIAFYALLTMFFLAIYILTLYLTYSLLTIYENALDNFSFQSENTLHELNTPVATIQMSVASLLKSASLDNEKKLKRILLATEKLLHLYDELEYFVRRETKTVEKTACELTTLISKELVLAQSLASQKNISFDILLHPYNAVIDQRGFCTAFSNIIHNAIKYSTHDSHILITLTDTTLCIQDHGSGIDKENLIRIFDRYYRAHHDSHGQGIGLSLVKRFCDENNVKLFIDSTIGSGTTVSFTFAAL